MLRFELLSEIYDITSFRSGNTYLDEYLRNDALRETRADTNRTFLAILETEDRAEIAGFFTLSTTYQFFALATDADADSVYPAEISYLARHLDQRGQGIGEALLIEALNYIAKAAEYVAFPGVWLTATPEGATLYERFGFTCLNPNDSFGRQYFMPMQQVRAIVGAIDPD